MSDAWICESVEISCSSVYVLIVVHRTFLINIDQLDLFNHTCRGENRRNIVDKGVRLRKIDPFGTAASNLKRIQFSNVSTL